MSPSQTARRAVVFVSVLASAMLFGAACGTPGWTLFVENASGSDQLIRVVDGADTRGYLLDGLEGEWLISQRRPPSGPIFLVDPTTCAELERIDDIPDYHTILVITEGGDVAIGEDGPGGLPDGDDLLATTDQCS